MGKGQGHALVTEFVERLARQFGAAAVTRIIKAFGEKRKPVFRVNTIKATDLAVMDVLREEGIAFERVKDIPHAFRIRNRTDEELLAHPLCRDGKIYLQGVSSMLPPLLLDPKPTERVLDLCAAPGSKTSEMAAMMKNEGSILACEENEIRFEKLKHTLAMQGGTNVEAMHGDAALLHHTHHEAFDKVLADVPCSAEGRISLDEPRSYRYWSEKNIVAHAKAQRRLLRSAVGCLKPGGTLVYSTCTLAPEENEGMVEWLTNEFPELRVMPTDLPLQSSKKTPYGTIVVPTEEHEGFFVAKLQKERRAE